jgi:hypothetical protein
MRRSYGGAALTPAMERYARTAGTGQAWLVPANLTK